MKSPFPKAQSLNTSTYGLWGGYKPSKPTTPRACPFLHHSAWQHSPKSVFLGTSSTVRESRRGRGAAVCISSKKGVLLEADSSSERKQAGSLLNQWLVTFSAWHSKGHLCGLNTMWEMMHLVYSSTRSSSPLQPPCVV